MSEAEQKPSILVVDDDANSRVAVRAALDYLDIDVVDVDSGENALIEILRHDFAMIVLDVGLPGMNGFETAQAIRERELSREIPIIFLTGHEEAGLQVNRGYDLGAVDYMLKPIVVESLRAKVKFSVKYHLEMLKVRENEKLQEATRKLAKLVTDLERSNHALDEFAYIASHDLKEPLRGITTNANFLLREKLSEAAQKRGRRIVELGVRMEQLIADLLRFSRLGRDESLESVVDASKIVEKSRKLFEEFAEESSAQLVVETELPTVKADPARVLTVFQNLIANALKYNDSNPKIIRVGFAESVEIDGKTLQNAFYVRDNGIGIDGRFHDKVFEIFTRLNAERDFGPGTGAGLAFVKWIIEEKGGEFGVKSSPGEGSTFFFSFPLPENTEILSRPTSAQAGR